MPDQHDASPELGHQFWYLLGVLEEVITDALLRGQANRELVRHRLARFGPEEHDSVVHALEVLVVALDFVTHLLEDLGSHRRPTLRRRAEIEALPATARELRERLGAIADVREQLSKQEAAGNKRDVGVTEASGATADAQRAVRTVLGLTETAASTMGMTGPESRRAVVARLESPSRGEISRHIWGARAVEAVIALLLVELEGEAGD